MTDIHIPDDVTKLDDGTLMQELENMAVHEDAEVLTEEQEQYLNNLRDEALKRMSTGGPYADYEGGE